MRFVCVLAVAALGGCNDGVAPPALVEQDQGVPDEGVVDQGPVDSAVARDLLTVDLLPSPDLKPQSCKTACDCPSGEHCAMGSCTSAMPMIFCCGTAACTGSAVCETSTGRVSQCSNPDGGVSPDAGVAAAACTGTACVKGPGSQLFCTLVCGKTATCQTNGGGMDRCAP
jgi:hypothetical protein